MKSVISLISLLAIIHIGAATASPQKPRNDRPCAGGSTYEMNQCAHQDYRTADVTLNKVYAELVSILEPDEKPQLKEMQLTWIKYRDANCNFVADTYKGGTMRPMVLNYCLADVTRQRTADLRLQIKERTQARVCCRTKTESYSALPTNAR